MQAGASFAHQEIFAVMKISLTKFKDVLALELKSQAFTAIVLPSEGGKIASFKDGEGEEFLVQNLSDKYGHVGLGDSYVDGECSGFDDMFPTIDEVEIIGADGERLLYPDHGEVCRMPFEYQISGDTLVMNYASSMGYSYKKTLAEKDGKLSITCEIANFSGKDLDALWAAHCLIRAEDGGEVLLPFLLGEAVDVQFDTSNRYAAGERLSLSREMLVSNFALAPCCNKLYFPNKTPKGYIGYRYPSGKVFNMEFDENTLPSIGVWQNYGVVKGYYCVGLEPCTVGYDTVVNAKKYGQSSPVRSGEKLSVCLKLGVGENYI